MYDCPQFFSPPYETDNCFDRIAKCYQDTVMHIDPITRKIFDYATHLSCDNSPQIVIALDPDHDEHYVLTPEPLIRAIPKLFQPEQTQSAISPNTFTAGALKLEFLPLLNLKNFANRVSFTEHSDTKQKLLGKANSYDFLAVSEQNPTNFYSPPNRNWSNP